MWLGLRPVAANRALGVPPIRARLEARIDRSPRDRYPLMERTMLCRTTELLEEGASACLATRAA